MKNQCKPKNIQEHPKSSSVKQNAPKTFSLGGRDGRHDSNDGNVGDAGDGAWQIWVCVQAPWPDENQYGNQ